MTQPLVWPEGEYLMTLYLGVPSGVRYSEYSSRVSNLTCFSSGGILARSSSSLLPTLLSEAGYTSVFVAEAATRLSSEADSASENSTRPVHGFRMVKALVVAAQRTKISRAVVAILFIVRLVRRDQISKGLSGPPATLSSFLA